MTRFRIEHPTDPNLYAIGGVDHVLGYFCEVVMREGGAKPINTLDAFTAERPVTLITALDFLANQGLISHPDLEDALLYMRDEAPEHGTAEARRIIGIIESFKAE